MRYTFRLRPGAQAQRVLTAEWHRCRFLWNEAVHQQKSGDKPTFAKLSKLLTAARSHSAWLRDGSQVAQQQTLRTYAQALDQSFTVKGRGRPAFKPRKKSLLSLEFTRRGFRIRDRRLVLPKGIGVPVVWSRELPSEPTSVRITRDVLGHWYASFVVRRDVPAVPEASGGIGVDWGVATTATTTDTGFDLPYLGHRKRCAAELARAQRKMARRHTGKRGPQSRGYVVPNGRLRSCTRREPAKTSTTLASGRNALSNTTTSSQSRTSHRSSSPDPHWRARPLTPRSARRSGNFSSVVCGLAGRWCWCSPLTRR
ncbi:transposase [Rhodococcus sp. LBL1]|nr:transposase [Rhodococcus sp. LBL1]MDH6681603.1 transposase [Rhodococcus sp. LBL2]